MLNKRVATLLIGTILMGSLAVGCGSSDSSNSNKITISGSTSVGPIVEILGEDFEAKNEGVSIEVQQIGSVDRFTETYPDQIVQGPRVGIVYFTMNFNKEPFQDVRVRKAVQMSIDRQAILDALYGGRGQVEQGIFPHGLIGFNPDQEEIKYDPEAAKALLAEAGYADGFDMEIAADSSASDTMTMALEIVSDQLAEVGIRAEIKNYDESTWLETRKSGELGSFMSTWSADYNDPDNFIYTFFGNEEKTRIRSINYPDTEVMERVAKARTIVNEDERLAEYKALEEKLIHEDAAWVPMFSRLHLFAVSKRVQGFAPLWSGLSDQLFYNISLSE